MAFFGGGFGMFGGGYGGGGTFEANYRAYPVSFIDKVDAENGDKVFLPPSALDRLAQLHIEYPMLFKLENRRDSRTSHCGVLEFVAEEGMVYMPYWMMQNLLLQEGDIVKLTNVTLPKGQFVKLQPHTKDFLDITNPKAVLETTLRRWSALTVGDCICLYYNNKRYYINIIEAKPQNAISVIETDCQVDFAPPLDYVEPERQLPTPKQEEPEAPEEPEPEPEPEEPKFKAFTGSGFRVDGKAPSASSPQPSSSGASQQPKPTQARQANGASTSGTSAAKKPAGKVVFGGGNRLLAKQQQATQPKPPPPPEEKKEEDSKFQAFQGRPNKLK